MWQVARVLSIQPEEVLLRLRDNDPEMAFAIAAETERFERDFEKWEAHFEHLQAIQKQLRAIAKGLSR